ncbi:MAG: amidohydrolase, partial [Candidatus Hydrogenedentota bacterium]
SQLLIRSACKTIGEQNVVILKEPSMVAEDFACYLEEIPGAFFFLGMANNAEEPYPPLHSNCYDFNDKALPTGISVMAELALRFLAEE